MCQNFPNTTMSLDDVYPRKNKNIYAQDGRCQYKHEEETVVPLQPNHYVRLVSYKELGYNLQFIWTE